MDRWTTHVSPNALSACVDVGPKRPIGRPRADESPDLIGKVGGGGGRGNEGDSATRFRALLRCHSIAVPFNISLGHSHMLWFKRTITNGLCCHTPRQCSSLASSPIFSAGRRLQLIPSLGPRDHVPLTLDLVTDGMRHCPDPTRPRENRRHALGSHRKAHFFSRNSRITSATQQLWDVQRRTPLLMTHGKILCELFLKQLVPTSTKVRHDPPDRSHWNGDAF